MIKIKKRRNFSDPMDSGSLTDLAFLLIIYFIVIAGFNINKGYLINLPDDKKPKIVQTEELMRIELNAQGQICRNEEILTTEQLETEIVRQRSSYPETTLLLTIHGDCPYQRMVDIVYQMRKLKVENFSFKMENNSL